MQLNRTWVRQSRKKVSKALDTEQLEDPADCEPLTCDDHSGQELEERHGLGAIYEKLFGTTLEGAHAANVDVAALERIFLHGSFWKATFGAEVVIKTDWLIEYAAATYGKAVAKVRGWKLEQFPVCCHGPMIPKAKKVTSTAANRRTGDEEIHTVTFTCHVHHCTSTDVGDHPDFEPPEPKQSKNGVMGACTCSGKCMRATCPCFSGQLYCGVECQHKSRKEACTNVCSDPLPWQDPLTASV